MNRDTSVLVVCLALSPLAAQLPDDDTLAVQAAVQRAAARVAPSVVRVETFGGLRKEQAQLAGGDNVRPEMPKQRGGRRPPRPDQDEDDKKPKLQDLVGKGFMQTQGATTGLVLSADGWIAVSRFALTYDPSTILVTLHDGRSFQAVRKGEDTSRGIALVKIEAEGLTVPQLLPHKDVQVGQWVAVLGRTFGTGEPSVHVGIVSALGRIFGRAVQIDANCSPANYGGPVIDLEGRVLGVSAPLDATGRDAGMEWYDSGIGFAATLEDIAPLLERMRAGEVLHRGWLGIEIDGKYEGPGVRLAKVNVGSTAAGVGLKAKDVLLSVDGVALKHRFHMQMLLASRMAGDAVALEVKRGEQTFPVTAFLNELPAAEREARKKGRVDDPLPWEGGGSGEGEGK